MKKVLVIGCPGSGKTTFSRKLQNKLHLPLIHLDKIFHNPDKTHMPREEFDALIIQILNKSEWIIDGNYNRTLEMRITFCDTIFLFDLPTDICLAGAESRLYTKRDDLPWIEETLDEQFKQWIIDFPKDHMPTITNLLEKYKENRNIIIFKTRKESDDYLDNLDTHPIEED